MDLGLSDKVVLVTGSSRGIGFAIAKNLITEGCIVVLNGRDRDALADAASRLGNPPALAADVSKVAACEELVSFAREKGGRLDALVCNVGSGRAAPPGEETADEWQHMFNVNLAATTHMVNAARPALADTGGAIVCTSSIAGIEALGAPVTYSAAKAALNSFVRGIARPLARSGIRINGLAPGNINFEGSVWDERLRDDPDAVKSMLETEVALGRLGHADEIADVAAFLLSERASFMTGTIVVADGGQVRG